MLIRRGDGLIAEVVDVIVNGSILQECLSVDTESGVITVGRDEAYRLNLVSPQDKVVTLDDYPCFRVKVPYTLRASRADIEARAIRAKQRAELFYEEARLAGVEIY